MAPLPGSHLGPHGRALWKLTAPWTHRTRPPRLGKRAAFSTSFHRAFPITNHPRKTPKGPKIALGNPDRPNLAISEFPKWRKYLILLSFLDNSSARPVQIGGVDVNICHSRSTAVRGRRRSSSQSPRKYLILLSFLDNSSARPVQIGGVDVNICHSRSTAVRGRRRSSSQSPPRGPFCRTRTGPVEADGAVDAQNAPTGALENAVRFPRASTGPFPSSHPRKTPKGP